MKEKDRHATLPLLDRESVVEHLEECAPSGLQHFAEYLGGVSAVKDNSVAFAEICSIIGAIRNQQGIEEGGHEAFTSQFVGELRERILKAYELADITVVQ